MKRRQKKGGHFSNIKKVGFYDTPINTTAEESVATWNELRLFFELAKPKELSDISTKATAISKSDGIK
jgi:hypothetical protein